MCQFSHYKPCQFGALCNTPGCTFGHPSNSIPLIQSTSSQIKVSQEAIDQISDSLPQTPPKTGDEININEDDQVDMPDDFDEIQLDNQ